MSSKVVSQHLQDSFLYLCITSDEFLGLVRPDLIPSFFSSAVCANCVRIVYDFWDTFHQAPKDHFHDELIKRLNDIPEKDRLLYAEYLKKIQGLNPPTFKYVITQVNDFIQCRELESAVIKCAELVKEGEFVQAKTVMHAAFRAGIEHENLGLDYIENRQSLQTRGEGPNYLMSTGIEALDKLIGGYSRSMFVCVMGGYKGNKSWALLHAAKTALVQGLKVLFVTHELTEKQVELRMDMMWGSMVTEKDPTEMEIKTRDKDGKFGLIKEVRPSVYDIDAVNKVRDVMRRMGGRFIIKKYPINTCSMMELNRYLDYLEQFYDFVPDVVINDYADIMEYSSLHDEKRHGLNEVYLGHKTIADERNILVITASQVTVEAIKKRRVSMADFSEDKRKAGNVDLALGISQTEKMEEAGMMTVNVVANRSGIMNVGCTVLYNLKIGQFCLSSWLGA